MGERSIITVNHAKGARQYLKKAEEALELQRPPEPMDGALAAELHYWMPKPKSVKRALPCVRPDIDKLARTTLDLLEKKGVVVEDSRIVDLRVRKSYAPSAEDVCVTVCIWTIEE